MEISTVDSPILTAFPGPEDSLIITRKNGLLQIFQNSICCSLETQAKVQNF